MKFKGAIFDMDGLLLDTEKLHVHFWIVAGEEFGYTLTDEILIPERGMSGKNAERYFKNIFGEDFAYKTIHDRRNEIFYEYCAHNRVDPMKGAAEILECLKQHGVKLALATSNVPQHSENVLRQNGLWDYFDAYAFGTMVEHSKPAPDIFLLAADQLGVDPTECLVFEDSTNGIYAASAAGCKPFMIPDLMQPTEDMHKLSTVLPDLLAARDHLLEKDMI